MKIYLKLLTVLLVISFLLSSFIACDNITEESFAEKTEVTDNKTTEGSDSESVFQSGSMSSETQSSEAESEYIPDIDQKDYKDEFFLWIQPEHNPVKYHWVEESDNDVMSQAVFDRQMKIYQYLGVDVVGKATQNGKNYVEPFKISVKNKDGSVDTLLSHVYHGIDGFITGNYLADFNSFSQINLLADYWDFDMMEDAAINGKYFLGKSDLNMLWTFVIAYNKDMMEKYGDMLGETVYEMVDGYRWTLDKMISLSECVYIDNSADGQTKDDTFGIIGCQDIAFCGFLHSSNIGIVEPDETGAYVLAAYNDMNKAKTTEIVDKIHALAKSNSAWFWKYDGIGMIGFQEGKSLMSLSDTKGHLPSYPNYDIRFGILPYPMYDEAQKDVGYRSLQWGGYICIPSYVENTEMVGDTVEMLSYYSDGVHSAFYEKLLGKQASECPEDSRMLDIVWDGLCTDFAQTYYGAFLDSQVLFLVPRLTYEDAEMSLAPFVASIKTSLEKKISKFLILASKVN